MKRLINVLAISTAILAAPPPSLALDLDDIMLAPFEVENLCEPIEGEHPVSIQAAVQYRLAGDKEGGAVYGSPVDKRFQSFQCGDAKTSALVRIDPPLLARIDPPLHSRVGAATCRMRIL